MDSQNTDGCLFAHYKCAADKSSHRYFQVRIYSYVMIMMVKLRCDHRSCNRKLSNFKLSPKKRFWGLQRDLKPWPLRSRCSALPTEL